MHKNIAQPPQPYKTPNRNGLGSFAYRGCNMRQEGVNRLYMAALVLVYAAVVAAAFASWAAVVVLAILAGVAVLGGAL